MCGSPSFCAEAETCATAMHASDVHREVFSPIVAGRPPIHSRRYVTIDGVSVEVLAGQTILDAALGAGVDLPHACMAGTCGECVCTVLSGGIVQSVSPEQAGAGDCVHTCVAWPSDPSGARLASPGQTDSQH